MSTLKEILCNAENRPTVIRKTAALVDSEVSSKSGLSGIAIRTGYKAVKAIKPTLITDVIDGRLEQFIEKVEPFFADWSAGDKSQPFDSFLTSRKREVANALLQVTDERAQKVDNRTIKKTYQKLRPQGEKNVEEAVPGLGRMIAGFLK